MISVVMPIWIDKAETRDWYGDLDRALCTWTNQTLPVEVVLVVMTDDAEIFSVAEKHNPTIISAPVKSFNMSWGFNVGITRAKGSFIACVGFEMMASKNFTQVIEQRATTNTHLSANCGFLGPDDTDVLERWDATVSRLEYKSTPGKKEGTYRPTVGALQVMYRERWDQLRGYDEELPFAYADSDIVNRARKIGLKRVIIPWEEAQLLHPHHRKSRLIGRLGGSKAKLNVGNPVRNPGGWGKL